MEAKEISGYSIYNVEAKKNKINPTDIYPKLPNKNMILFMLTHLGIIMERCNMTNPA